MGNPPTKDFSKWATNGMLSVALLGGTPYIVTLQTELRQTHDAVIRLEERAKSKDEQWLRMEAEQQRMREQIERLTNALHDKKVVGQLSPASNVAGEKYEQ